MDDRDGRASLRRTASPRYVADSRLPSRSYVRKVVRIGAMYAG
ncbi:MAG: hypothetical protein AVDCRST_MAG14-2529 [uncultured Rubrobacteraceae bacterium]|uniref:Uncharacterized protein n=1 Tax=uncultured Rubrobacteraceae bacterium TaxID=349277 RepID=A0A6J4R3A4_9ACTN|nr:MAG: hypothetical protein AVDCRST_MAG14-2529 [uncultured Rubrobacteraceae bacterium]